MPDPIPPVPVPPSPNPTPTPPEPSWFKRLLSKYGPWLAFVLVGYLIRYFAGIPFEPPPFPQEPTVGAMGWVDDPPSVQAIITTLPIQGFDETPAYRAGDEPEQVFLWEFPRRLFGQPIPCRDQKDVGACVAFGEACAIEHLICIQIAQGRNEEYHDVSQEVIYGGSRVQIGNGRIRGDGSTGAWGAQWSKQYGQVARGVHGRHDLTSYSTTTCRQFGSRGVPDDLVPLARQRPCRAITPVRTAAECRLALANGYTVTVASSQGFRMSRDSEGFCAASGTWMHQMCILGYQKGTRPGFWIQNSWGPDAHKGPKGAGNPPDGGFWADERTVERMLAQGDSFAHGDMDGFPSRKLNWFIKARPRRLPLDLRPEFAMAP